MSTAPARRSVPARPPARVSPRTGEPVRGWVTWLSSLAFWGAATVVGISLAQALWTLTSSLEGAARLVDLLHPKVASLLAVLSPVFLALIALVPIIASGVAAFQGWNGRPLARWVGIAAVVATGLGWFLTPIALAAIPVALVGAVLLWLPASRRYQVAQEHRRLHADDPGERLDWPAHLHYGPLPRYR